jgi:putative molybdopterin biosynthesis protein
MTRNLYLRTISVEDAQKKIAALIDSLTPQFEEIPAEQALGRMTASAVFASLCSPLFNAAAMDGIAVNAAATAGARENSPVELTGGKDFLVVDTGDPVKPPYDSVIMAEELIEIDENTVRILQSASPWQYVRPIGEDFVAGEMLIPSRHAIRAVDIGVLLSGGVTSVTVYKKPRVAVFPTGNELIEPGQAHKEGGIIDSNSRMIASLVAESGGEAARFAAIPDDVDLLRAAVDKAVSEFDVVILNAGSSAGTEDFTSRALESLGEIIIHGVAMKPGKPVIIAKVRGKPVIGLPGYPVSAYLAYENFVSPIISFLTGSGFSGENFRAKEQDEARAVMAKRLVSSLKHREYVRVTLGFVDGKLVASPLARGAGSAMSLVRADGFCVIEQNREGIEAGEETDVTLCRPLSEIQRTIVSIGSHDLILDVISDLLNTQYGARLAGTHVGSLAGLMALKRGESHIAPTHLLDEKTGEYNMRYLREIFGGQSMALIKGVGRVQGLIVPKGNPLRITGVDSVAHAEARYVNRQRGAGTRLFFDHLLAKEGIDARQINGYEREAATHMAVAAAVQSGSADAGMGIMSAASALDLGFIPLGDEEYDFAVYKKNLESKEIVLFLQTLKNPEFHKKLELLGGYTYNRIGEIVFV